MHVLDPIVSFFTKQKPKFKDRRLSILTTERLFIENGCYKIRDEYSQHAEVVTLCKVEDGEDLANKKAIAVIRKSFDALMYDFVQTRDRAPSAIR